MKTVYYVRHGESEGNAADLMMGSKDDLPLTAKGEQQAREATPLLKQKPIALIVSSPLKRALRTAQIIATGIGYKEDILTSSLLVERDFGKLSGKPRKEALAVIDDPDPSLGVETLDHLYNRMTKAVDWLRSLPADCILVVGHGGAGMMLRAVIEQTPATDFLQYQSLGHAAVYEFMLR
jgi:broad specificity phosphatase PhoE